jgi:multiple sugar transport system substrate-binding protein
MLTNQSRFRAPCHGVVIVVSVLLCAGGMIGCDRHASGSGAEQPVSLRFWNGFTGPDGRTMLAIVKRFNQENPDVHVTMQRMEWGTYYNKLFVAGLGGRSPDVFVIHTDSLARFRQARLLRPMEDVANDGLDPADFDANVWSAVSDDAGVHFAIPLDIHLLGMYYNRALFRQAGIVDDHGQARPPRTRDEFLQAAKRLTMDTNGDGRTDLWGFVFDWMRIDVYTLFRQWDGDIFSADHHQVEIDSNENVAALQFGADLIAKLKVAPSPANFDAFIGFRQGKVGMCFQGIFMLTELQRQTDLDWAAAPLPVLGKQPAAWANSHNLCLRADLQGQRLSAAERFVKYLSDHSLDWAEAGQIPVRKSLRNSARFAAMSAQREFASQIPYAAYMPRVLFVNVYLTEFDVAVEAALRGSKTPRDALAMAAERIRTIMRRFDHQAEALSSKAD